MEETTAREIATSTCGPLTIGALLDFAEALKDRPREERVNVFNPGVSGGFRLVHYRPYAAAGATEKVTPQPASGWDPHHRPIVYAKRTMRMKPKEAGAQALTVAWDDGADVLVRYPDGVMTKYVHRALVWADESLGWGVVSKVLTQAHRTDVELADGGRVTFVDQSFDWRGRTFDLFVDARTE